MDDNTITNAPVSPYAEINYFYISDIGNPQPKTVFNVTKDSTDNDFIFEFRIGVVRQQSNTPLRVAIDMNDGHYFIDELTDFHEFVELGGGLVATEITIQNAIINVLPGQHGMYVVHLFEGDSELTNASTRIYIVGV